nr:unnamed protein product [uncultured bacterium]
MPFSILADFPKERIERDMKLKLDIEKAYTIIAIKRNEAKGSNDAEMVNYYTGYLNALNWIRGSRETGIDDLGV